MELNYLYFESREKNVLAACGKMRIWGVA